MTVWKTAASATCTTFFMVLFAHLIPASSASPSTPWEWITLPAMQFYRGHGLATEVVRIIITLAVWFLIYGIISGIRAGASSHTQEEASQA